MKSDLFNPQGDISPDSFMRAGIVLILITVLINALPMVSVDLGAAASLIMIVISYCWIVLFIKRFRRGGKSGWMCLLAALAFVAGYFLLSNVVQPVFGGDIYTEFRAALEDVMLGEGDFMSKMGVMTEISEEYADPLARKIALPGALLYALLSFVILWGFNQLIPNQKT